MKNKLIMMMVCFSFAILSCEKKASTSTEVSNSKIDETLKSTKLSDEAQSTAKEITAENVDEKADALLKEIENDSL